MKIFLLTLLFFVSLSFAVQPVPKSASRAGDDDNIKTVVKNDDNDKNANAVKEDKNKSDVKAGDEEKDKEAEFDLKGKIKNITDRNGDKIIDVDSNNVNDQREKDFDKIKQLESKFKDLFKRDNNRDNDKNGDDDRDKDDDSKNRKAEPKKTVPPSKHRPAK